MAENSPIISSSHSASSKSKANKDSKEEEPAAASSSISNEADSEVQASGALESNLADCCLPGDEAIARSAEATKDDCRYVSDSSANSLNNSSDSIKSPIDSEETLNRPDELRSGTEEPAKESNESPVKESHAKESSTKESSAKETPAKETPAKETPAKGDSPVRDTIYRIIDQIVNDKLDHKPDSQNGDATDKVEHGLAADCKLLPKNENCTTLNSTNGSEAIVEPENGRPENGRPEDGKSEEADKFDKLDSLDNEIN